MIFLDSWIWLEFLFDGEKAQRAESVIERADSADVGGLIAPTVIAEISYRIRSVESEQLASEAISAITDYSHIESVPIVDDIGEHAAALRFKYYDRTAQALSYADAIHLAIASLHDSCDTLYTGDPDFEGVDEIETVVL